ncbi:HAMP domain-containing sensor histidine kinase [Paenibacillus sediminis]|uniref:histidine kinase n=1 Tax=Paenibacillus sediminis TaxID=664909 RepID=A0ABS4H086_9BACL|nr:HAMP domain-containing sensor histidine kinase [Paenibacillus sediminis]MBP1935943.1 signal transduction histidine kinase [Paenibacillus sediminis]
MIKKGIGRLIVLHYFFVIFLALLLVEVIFIFAIRAYYYDSIFNHLSNHAALTSSYFQKFVNLDSEEEYTYLPEMLKLFSLDNTELQIIDKDGKVLINSTGFENDRTIQTSDITQALAGNVGRWIGRQPGTGEQVMAVSSPLQIRGEKLYIIRYITSLETLNEKLLNITFLAVGIGAAVLAVVLMFSIGLANSIVKPIKNITAVSAQMAQGNLDVRVKGEYRHELQELASTLNFMADQIVHSNQIKDDFISSISHELRTPLTGIKGWSETLSSGSFDPEETKMGMQIITKEADRLIGLVEEILDFSKLQQNEMKLVISRVNLRELLQETILNVWTKAEQKHIKVKLTGEEEPVWINADPNRMKQVFLNIVDNAIKFSHENCWVNLNLKKYDHVVEVAVQDTGIGISEEHLMRVKDRFFQVNPLNGGTGLGLAITQQLVELHGGHMDIESQLGVGTTVTVILPLSKDDVTETNQDKI